MIQFLSRILIKNRKDYHLPSTRTAYGILCGAVGIFLNLCLFAAKFLAGTLSGSIAITADAFNNLSDAVSSIITLLGFRLAGHKPDSDHPFGHGRVEYISGLLVSILILVMAFELIKTSFDKIMHPALPVFSLLTLLILLLSILVKGYMAYYNRSIGRKIDSAAMSATAIDSFSDMLATSLVLLSSLICHFTGFNPDGWCGIFVGLFILYSGGRAAWDTISPLLGQAPDPAFVKKVTDIVMEQEGILGIHDLSVHSYGPGNTQITLHAEVSAAENIMFIHDRIDNVEHRLKKELGCSAVIHMDPVETEDCATQEYKKAVQQLLQEMDPQITMHDFHVNRCQDHPELHFDLVVPYHFSLSEEDLIRTVTEKLRHMPAPLSTFDYMIEVDHRAD